MATEFRLPQLTESMASVKLSTWLKREGDAVKQGEPIAEVETDKTTVELEAPESGVLQAIHVRPGTEAVTPGTLLATIGDGAAAAVAPAASKASPAAAASTAEPKPARPETAHAPVEARSASPAPQTAKAEPPQPRATAGAAASAIEPSVASRDSRIPGAESRLPSPDSRFPSPESRIPNPEERILSTALAARMAKVAGIDLSSIPAAGRRITKADVEAVLRQQRGEPAARGNGAAVAPLQPAYEDKPLTAMRRVTATRLQQAKQTIPHFYLQVDCRVDALLDLRKQINASITDLKVTVTDLLVLACASALRRVPEANSEWLDGTLRVHDSVDIAVAVATPQGLITPIVRECHRKPLAAISRDLKDLSERARAGRLKPEEYTHGTFTLSNLGMYGVTRITPIINPPQSCILGVGAVEPRPVIEGGQIVAGNMMSCTLAADHRAIDGATGAQLLAEIRRRIEQPLTMMLGV